VAGFSDAFENALLQLIFNAVAIADLAADDQSSPATTITVALHTGDPGDSGNMSTNETAYTNYVRKTVARTAGGWTVSGNSVSPAANIDFAECGATPGAAITHWSVGSGVSNQLIGAGALTPNITMASGVIPRIKTTSTITLD
jgi:hypothetical protein